MERNYLFLWRAAGNKVTDNFKAQECLEPLENRI